MYEYLDTWPHSETTLNRTWRNTFELDIIEFVLRSWRSESCTEYWLWCAALSVVADRTTVVSTWLSVCKWSHPWHVWIDSRTSVKCVKDGRCMEGCCGHLVCPQTFFQDSVVTVQISFVCDSFRDGCVSVCLDTWPHWETTPKPDFQHSRTWYRRIFLEKFEEWVVYRVLTLMCLFVCGYGPVDWRVDSTFRLWVIPLLTCVNRFQDECEVCEGWSVYGGLLRTSC